MCVRSLDLSRNALTELDSGTFGGAQCLGALSLAHNMIHTVYPLALAQMDLLSLDLSFNALVRAVRGAAL